MHYFVVICLLTLPIQAEEYDATRNIPKHPVTQDELRILEFGELDSASTVYYRLTVLLQKKGVNSVRIAVPAVNILLAKFQSLESNDSCDETEGDIVAFLGKVGDISSQQVLLNAIERDNGNAAIGLAKMPSAVDSVITYLEDEQLRIRSKAARCLVRMQRYNSSLFTKVRTELIRDKLVENLGRYEYKGSDCFALAFFGDSTTIPILTKIVATDTLRGLGGKYSNRRFAQYAIDHIRQR